MLFHLFFLKNSPVKFSTWSSNLFYQVWIFNFLIRRPKHNFVSIRGNKHPLGDCFILFFWSSLVEVNHIFYGSILFEWIIFFISIYMTYLIKHNFFWSKPLNIIFSNNFIKVTRKLKLRKPYNKLFKLEISGTQRVYILYKNKLQTRESKSSNQISKNLMLNIID